MEEIVQIVCQLLTLWYSWLTTRCEALYLNLERESERNEINQFM